jgi:outer membrane biosynthesis protein TonB
MQHASAALRCIPQRFMQRKAVHPVVWTLLFSCAVHGLLLLQTFLFKTSQPINDSAKALVVRWLAPPPAIPMQANPQREPTANTPASHSQLKPIKQAQAATKVRAVNSQPSAQPNESSNTASQEPPIARPAPQAKDQPDPAQNSTLQAAPTASPSANPSADAGTGAGAGATQASSSTKQLPQLDLSQANLKRAATQASTSSLAYKARVHTGLEPEPQARIFAKNLAAAAIPNCLSHSNDGEGQPLAGPSGNLLYLPMMARDAILGKCKMMP